MEWMKGNSRARHGWLNSWDCALGFLCLETLWARVFISLGYGFEDLDVDF